MEVLIDYFLKTVKRSCQNMIKKLSTEVGLSFSFVLEKGPAMLTVVFVKINK